MSQLNEALKMPGWVYTQEHYIEHEVQLRVSSLRFSQMEGQFIRLESKLNWIITLVISGILLPVVLHYFGLI